MTKRHLSVFLQVCKECNMTRAATVLYMTQPAVSQTIGELESYYGAQLFERNGKKLQLTDAGRALQSYAQGILQLFDAAEQNLHAGKFTTLRIGANLSVGRTFLVDAVKQFQKEAPLVRVQVQASGSKKLQKLLLAHEIAFALIEDTRLDSNLVCTPFYADKLVVVAATDSPYASAKKLLFEDLKDADFLLRERGAGARDALDHWLQLHNIRIYPLWESADTELLVKAVQAGIGISVLPYLLVKEHIERHEIAPVYVQNLPLKRNLNIVHHRNKEFSATAAHFLEVLQKGIPS